MGAMLYGRVGQERLQLNENTLWAGAPYTPANPDALPALPQVRALIDQGRYKEAEDLVSEKMMAKPLVQMPYGTLGDLLLTFADTGTPEGYERALDLGSAIASVAYRQQAKTIRRDLFASAPDRVIILRIEATVGTIGFHVDYRGPRKIEQLSAEYTGESTATVPSGPIDWHQQEDVGALPPGVTIRADGKDAILMTGRNASEAGVPSGLTYALRVQAIGDGRISVSGQRLTVDGAKAVTLIIAAATSYVRYDDTSGDPVAAVRATCAAATRKGYAAIRRDHIADHHSLFDRFAIALGDDEMMSRSTDERIAAAETEDDPGLAALYLQYARYLTIACSRLGGQPSNLQGMWNEGLNPPWGSKYTININTEMNYWPTAPAALPECAEPLLRMVEDLAVTGATTARVMYGAKGWVTHHNTDLWRASAPIDFASSGMWPTGGAWLCNTLWNHWDYNRSDAMLQRLYPLMVGASQFFLDTLVADPKGRGLVTSPSISPENKHPYGASVCAGPAMDRQILRDLFDYTIDAARRLGRDAAFSAELQKARARLAPDRIGAQGQLQEWLDDWDAAAPEPHHRHVSHLYAVYPSSQINLRDTPKLVEAAKETLRQRGDLTTGWGTAWRACLWARMGDGEHAYQILKGLLGPVRTYPNMFDAHPPFQIDGNFGGAAAIMEMVAQSWGDEVRLLPALPAAWSRGSVSGMKLRGGLSLSLAWADGKVKHFTLHGQPGQQITLWVAGSRRQVSLDKNGTLSSHQG